MCQRDGAQLMLCTTQLASRLRPEQAVEVAVDRSPIAPRRCRARAASCSTTLATYGRLVALAAIRDRRQVGAVGLDQQPIRRRRGGRLAERLGLGNVATPGIERKKPVASARSAAPGSPGEAVEDAAQPALPSSCEDAQRVVLGLARVNHDRQVAARARAGSARETPRAARRAARSRSGNRGRSRRWRARAGRRVEPRRPPCQPPACGFDVEHVGVMGMDADRETGTRARPRAPFRARAISASSSAARITSARDTTARARSLTTAGKSATNSSPAM